MNRLHRALAGALLLGGTHLAAGPLSVHAASVVPLCSARTVHATASTQRTGSASFGSVMFTNTGPRSCALRGRVGVRLADSRGRALPVAYVYRKSDLYGRRIPPYVVLTPHARGAGYVQLLWRNWCGARLAVVRVVVTLSGGQGSEVAEQLRRRRVIAPSCTSPHTRSTVSIGPPELFHF